MIGIKANACALFDESVTCWRYVSSSVIAIRNTSLPQITSP